MDNGKWTLADSGLSKEQKEALEAYNTEKTLSQIYFDIIKEHVLEPLDPREVNYVLNDIHILRTLNDQFFWYHINESVKKSVNDIPCKGKINWHNKCKCGNYILHTEPIYPRRGTTMYRNVRCLCDTNIRYIMRIHNVCYTCAKRLYFKVVVKQEV